MLIESRIVIVTNDFERDLGARFGVTATRANGTNGLYETTGTAAGTDTGISSALSNLATNGTVYPVSIPTGATAINRYNVNLPVATPAGSIALGILGSDFLVDLELSAAQIENRGTVISSPRVITANQKEASIEQGVEIPYQQSASSGATTIDFKEAVLSLKVKPLITPDNRIILDLTVSDDSVGTGRGGLRRRQRTFDQHPHHHDPGGARRRPNRGARRHPRDHAEPAVDQGAVAGRRSGSGKSVQRDDSRPITKMSC